MKNIHYEIMTLTLKITLKYRAMGTKEISNTEIFSVRFIILSVWFQCPWGKYVSAIISVPSYVNIFQCDFRLFFSLEKNKKTKQNKTKQNKTNKQTNKQTNKNSMIISVIVLWWLFMTAICRLSIYNALQLVQSFVIKITQAFS